MKFYRRIDYNIPNLIFIHNYLSADFFGCLSRRGAEVAVFSPAVSAVSAWGLPVFFSRGGAEAQGRGERGRRPVFLSIFPVSLKQNRESTPLIVCSLP
jgi:hypothetical protein